MNILYHKTCVLYFSTGNSSSKSFSLKKRCVSAIQKILFNKTLLEIKKSNLPFLISGNAKNEASFAEKINIAVNSAFNKGFDKIILVGDDTPQLSAAQLLKAAQSLEKNELSVGPSEDGGAYLISFTQQQFKDGLLNDLAWQKEEFYESLVKNIININLDFRLFSKFSDLDSAADIHQFLQTHAFLNFTKILRNICEHQKIQIPYSFLIVTGHIIRLKDRGPPMAA